MIELIAVLSLVLQKYTDLAIALALLVVNVVVSFFQEQRASAAVAALRCRLQKYVSPSIPGWVYALFAE